MPTLGSVSKRSASPGARDRRFALVVATVLSVFGVALIAVGFWIGESEQWQDRTLAGFRGGDSILLVIAWCWFIGGALVALAVGGLVVSAFRRKD